MIDHRRLDEMEHAFGSDEVAGIVAAFIEEAASAVRTLVARWEDDAVRRDRLHFLKGCAWTVGAAGLGDLCERLEERDPGPDGPRALEREFRAAEDALRARMLDAACIGARVA